MTTLNSYPIQGYLLEPPGPVPGYRGIDRNPFTPSLIEGEYNPGTKPQQGDSRIWVWYPPGWRREAYRLYEENLVPGTGAILLDLLSSLNVAREIQKIIEPHIGPHEIVACAIWSLDSVPNEQAATEPSFLGYDVAYLGGDFYSAVLNGLFANPKGFYNPHPILVNEYKHLLNEFGLFPTSRSIPEYHRRFRELVQSEANSQFYVYELSSVS